jgi:hypothetical protein
MLRKLNSISNIYSSEVYALNLDLFLGCKQTNSVEVEDVLSGARSASSPEIAFNMKV